jgi:ABC-2 type transport system permease protein
MELAIFSQALRDSLRFRRIWPWLALGVVCFGMAFAWKQFNPDSLPADRYASVTLIFVYRILALLSAVLTAAILTQEVEQKTIVYLLTRPVPRWKLLLFRYLASVLVVFLVSAFALTLTNIGAYQGVPRFDAAFGRDLAALGLGSLAYGALFMFVSLLFNRAMLFCLLFAFGWETAIPNMPGEMYKVSINSYLQAISDHGATMLSRGLSAAAGTLGTSTITVAWAVAVLGTICLGFVAASLWWFTHFEYVPRDDAE